MNNRGFRRYLDDLLAGRRPRRFQPDDFEAAQIRTAIDLQAARQGMDVPREEFLTDLHGRLAAQMEATEPAAVPPAKVAATRRQVIVGTSAAAAAAVTAVAVDRVLFRGDGTAPDGGANGPAKTGGELTPNGGDWQVIAKSSDVVADGVMHPFEVGSVIGFVRRVDNRPEAVSGVCTHQGCKLWFDKPDDRLRCPCHLTSFGPAGQVLSHQLSVSPAPLPQLMVRENNGAIEVFAPPEPTEPA